MSLQKTAIFDFSAFPHLRTRRLLLREVTFRDTDALYEMRSDPEVSRHNIGQPYTERSQARQIIEGLRRGYRERREVRWAVTLIGGDNRLIGMCGFNYWNQRDRRASLGYELNRSWWRQGIMREAVEALIEFAFERLEVNRLEAEAGSENTASIRLLEALHFQREGIQRQYYFEDGSFHDLCLYGLLQPEWEAVRKDSAAIFPKEGLRL